MRPQARFATIAFVPIRRGGGPKTHALAGGLAENKLRIGSRYGIMRSRPSGPEGQACVISERMKAMIEGTA